MSLVGSKTVEIILAEILMEETIHSGGFLIVEGDDDGLFWRGRVNSSSCKIVICGGKTNVIGVASKLDKKNNERVLGVIDTDFERITDSNISYSERLIMTDEHDLDVMLLLSPALDRVLVEQADQSTFIRERGQSLRDCLTEYATYFGRFRYLHFQIRREFDADRFSPYRYIALGDFVFNQHQLVQDLLQNMEWDDETLGDALNQVPSAPTEQIIQGHDALIILCIALKGICKPVGGQSIKESELRKLLRLAFHRDDLCITNMYQTMLQKDREWGLSMFPLCA